MSVGIAGGDDHRVGDVGEAAYVEQSDVDCLHVVQSRKHEFFQRDIAPRSAARASRSGHAVWSCLLQRLPAA